MSHPLPRHASVVVIGGGVMGCSTLFHLAKMGVSDAILLERNQLTSGTTWHSAAQVRALRHSQNLTRMIQYSVDLYSQLEKETGQSVGWIQKGSLSIATHPDRLIHIKRQEALAKVYGVEAHSISAAEAQERWPLMNASDVIGAVWSPEDGRVSPSDVCAALVKAAKTKGAQLFENTGVTAVLTRQGRITGVETSNGVIQCDAIALCAGLWSREVGAMAGAEVPLLACEHFYLLTKPVQGISGNLPTLSDHDSQLYIRDDSGGLLVGCFEPQGKPIAPGLLDATFAFGLLPEDWDHFEPMMELALQRLPALQTAEVKMLLNGPESFTPDGTFMLGETAETRGLFLGCGMNSVGMASGGGAGMNLAHCIVHGAPTYDLSEADAKRFAPIFNSVEQLMARAPEILGTHYDIAYPGKQLASARNLRMLTLHSKHRKHNAHMGQFFGWERPLYFGKRTEPVLSFSKPDWFDNVGSEVLAAHRHAAVFDNSSFGKIDIEGPDAENFMLQTCAGFVGRAPGAVIYTAILNDRGTFESDVTVQRLATSYYRVFTATQAIKRDLAWFTRAAEQYDISIRDTTEQYAVLALMGPEASAIQCKLGGDLDSIGFFKHSEASLASLKVRAARLSYVGESGWELTCDSSDVAALYDALLNEGAQPAGLFAQSAMRIEKGFCAVGHELDSDISPLEAGLDKFVRPDGNFTGYTAMQERRNNPPKKQLRSLLFSDITAVPLGHEPVYSGNRIIGKTTSCAFGYRLGQPAGLSFIDNEYCRAEQSAVKVDIGGELVDADVVHGPLYDATALRMKL